jgi:hypothetical protein
MKLEHQHYVRAWTLYQGAAKAVEDKVARGARLRYSALTLWKFCFRMRWAYKLFLSQSARSPLVAAPLVQTQRAPRKNAM